MTETTRTPQQLRSELIELMASIIYNYAPIECQQAVDVKMDEIKVARKKVEENVF